LDELRHRGPATAIIVEGDRDVEALEYLEVPGPIVKLNKGVSLLDFCETIAREYPSFILLTDWDPKGKELVTRLEGHLITTGATVDTALRKRLGGLVRFEIQDVEGLDKHIDRLRQAAGVDRRRRWRGDPFTEGSDGGAGGE
jgi:5S rRNA maturation endonuclease (ribonuclease M5)